MTSIKVKFRSSPKEGKEGAIYYQIIHNRVVRQIVTDYHIWANEWDAKFATVIVCGNSRVRFLKSVRERIHWDMERLDRICKRFDSKCLMYSADDIVEEYRRYSNEYSFLKSIENSIVRLKENGQTGTAHNYISALNSFRKFHNDCDIMLDNVSSELMEQYEAWLKQRGIIPNTISFYIRIFRAVYRRAVEEGIIEDRNPFRHVYTGIDKTVKRALTLKTLRKMKSYDLSMKPKLSYARDIFFLSLYLRGMSFIDMCFLRKTDLKAGFISYRRRKTGQLLTIAWTKEMQQILDRYPANESDYLLPIITHKGSKERCVYKATACNINRNLKKIGELIGAKDCENWSLYRARHSWASLAKAKGIPISIISEAMGHDSESTTQIYLASLRTSVVDKANSVIIKSI